MVRDDAQTNEVIRGKNGLMEGLKSGSTIVISSTVSPSLCQSLAKEADKKGVGVLDCPVSGAKAGAEAGTLTLMVGGDENVFKKVEPILQAVSKNIFYLGGSGMGEVAKLANNMITFTSIAATTEGLAYGVKAGISLETILELIKVSTGNTWAAQAWDALTVLKEDHSATASLHLVYKDLKLGVGYAKEIGVDLPLISQSGNVDLWRLPE